jgi:hypothetical protein
MNRLSIFYSAWRVDIWLFGSGLIGLTGVARNKKS